MKKSNDIYKTIFDNLPDIYYETNKDGNILIISPSVEKHSGYKPYELLGKDITLLFAEDKYENLFLNELFINKTISNSEMELRAKDGGVHHTLVSANLLEDETGKGAIVSGLIRDICDRKKIEEKLYRLATYDEMTGTYNRRVGIEFLNQELKKLKRVKTFLSIGYIDIDGLKDVNDNFGHEAGDNLIKSIIQDIKEAMRESDILSRLGGDEFLLIFPDCQLKEVKSIWNRVEESLEKRNSDVSIGYNISASYGFAETSSENEMTGDELLQIADKRMYDYKRDIKLKQQKLF